MLLPTLHRAAHTPEMPEGPVPLADLSQCLADVARLNGLFGGRLITLAHVKRLLAGVPVARPVTVPGSVSS